METSAALICLHCGYELPGRVAVPVNRRLRILPRCPRCGGPLYLDLESARDASGWEQLSVAPK